MSAQAEPMRWNVELADGDFHDVGAARLEVSGGCLVFFDELENVIVAYGSLRWVAVNAE